MLKEGVRAPDFELPDDRGGTVSLRDYLGKKAVVLFFFPKADTPGWTREASGFRDAKQEIEKRGAAVIGVSADNVSRQARFRDKYDLNMPLLADTEKKVSERYGVYKEKTMYGKKVMGLERTTVVIGKDGVVKKIFPKVRVEGHIEAVLQALDDIQ